MYQIQRCHLVVQMDHGKYYMNYRVMKIALKNVSMENMWQDVGKHVRCFNELGEKGRMVS
jgi:hypothetical protein